MLTEGDPLHTVRSVGGVGFNRLTGLVLGSCLLALAVNFLATYLIAATSPLTYQVAGP